MPRRLRLLVAATAGVVGALSIAAAATAVLTGHSGTTVTRFEARTQNVAWATPASLAANTYIDVPGMAIGVAVPSGTVRTLHASYSAESQCSGGGWCSVRIVAVGPNGTVVLNPQAENGGLDFAFDSPGGDNYQANTINRTSYRLPAGTYVVKVQAAEAYGATSFRLDEQNFSVLAFA